MKKDTLMLAIISPSLVRSQQLYRLQSLVADVEMLKPICLQC